jgi:phage terminase large subunit
MATELVSELSRPKRESDEVGRIIVESKKKMAKRGIKSPNLADSLIMCYAPIAKAQIHIG